MLYWNSSHYELPLPCDAAIGLHTHGAGCGCWTGCRMQYVTLYSTSPSLYFIQRRCFPHAVTLGAPHRSPHRRRHPSVSGKPQTALYAELTTMRCSRRLRGCCHTVREAR